MQKFGYPKLFEISQIVKITNFLTDDNNKANTKITLSNSLVGNYLVYW